MHRILDTNGFARFFFQTDEPTKAQVNSVSAMCREGRIKGSYKVCSKWFIDATAEWPELFPDVDESTRRPEPEPDRPPVITADMRLGDALALVLDILTRGEANAARKQKVPAAATTGTETHRLDRDVR